MTIVLSPEQERFAESCVSEGGYSDVQAVVQSALELLRKREEAKAAFAKTLEDARAESDRVGWVSLDEALARMDAAIESVDAG